MTELERLIEQQRKDAINFRVWSTPLDTPTPRVWINDRRHGTLFGYVRLRCRCAKCRAVSAAYQRARRTRDPELRERERLARARLRAA